MPLTIDNPPWKQLLWIPPKSNSNETETFLSLVDKDLFQNTSRNESHRIYRKIKTKR